MVVVCIIRRNPNMFTTHHGSHRLRQRFKIEVKNHDAAALEVLDKGLPREKIVGELRRFVDKHYFSHNTKPRLFVWHNALWIFSGDDWLITCHPLPGHLAKHAVSQIERWSKTRKEG